MDLGGDGMQGDWRRRFPELRGDDADDRGLDYGGFKSPLMHLGCSGRGAIFDGDENGES